MDKVQQQRFEMKYVISEHKAQSIRYFVNKYLGIDEYGATHPRLSYPVHSLYLDSPTLKTYHDTINGNRNRFKLRIRYYEGDKQDAVFFEEKRRYDRVITKKRAKVPSHVAEQLVYGHSPTMDCLVDKTEEQLNTLQQVCRLMHEFNVGPKVHVSYLREAYEMEDSNKVRITFDRDVTTEYVNKVTFPSRQKYPTSVFGDNVILEIKFTNRYPYWINEMTQLFHLRIESAAKYVDGINRMKRNKIIA